MKLATLLLGAFVALLSSSANAYTFDVTGSAPPSNHYVDMGVVSAGDSGTIATTPFYIMDETGGLSGVHDYVANGDLAGRTTVTFTYNVTPSAPDGAAYFWYTPNALSEDYLVTTTKDFDKNIFTIAIANLLDTALSFSTGLQLAYFKGTVETTYNAVSNVPLPAALPLFGLGLAGLAGYRRMKGRDTAKA